MRARIRPGIFFLKGLKFSANGRNLDQNGGEP